MSALLRFPLWLTLRRVRTSWRLLLASAFAILLASVLMSATAIYSGGLAESGLRHALARADQDYLNVQVVVQQRPLGPADYEQVRQVVDGAVAGHLGWLHRGSQRYVRSMNLPMVASPGQRPSRGGTQSYVFFFTGFEQHATVTEGRWPGSADASMGSGPLEMEVAVGADAAQRMQWKVGTRIYVVPFFSDPSENVALTVVGLMVPNDPQDEYWLGNLGHFRIETDETQTFIPLYVPEQAFFGGLGARYPALLATYWWYVFLNTGSLAASDVLPTASALDLLETDVNNRFPRSFVFTVLNQVLETYQQRLVLSRVPLFLYSSLVVAVLFYYLFLLTGLLSRARAPEVALLRSRGATPFQVVALLGFGEGILVALPAVLAGPFLALLANRFLFAYGLGAAGAGFSARLSPGVFGLSAAVGVLAVGVLGLAGLGMSWRGLVQLLGQRARPPATLFLQRYFLDFLILAVVGLLWWQIRGRGGFVTARLLGQGVSIAPSLLLGPALGLLAGGLLLLRLFPLLLGVLARGLAPLNAIWLLHALRRMARDPTSPGALAVLLMLTTALGVFGAIFGTTLVQSQRDQTRYALGGQVVLKNPVAEYTGEQRDVGKQIAAVPGVAWVSPLYRSYARASWASSSADVAVLGVTPESLPSTTWFRKDFAQKDLVALLEPLRLPLPAERGLRLPAGTGRVGLWVKADRPYPGFTLWLRLRDGTGRFLDVALGGLQSAGWVYLETPITGDDAPREPPLTLTSLFVTGARLAGLASGSLVIDDVTVLEAGGTKKVIEGFEGNVLWVPIPGAASGSDSVRQSTGAAKSGRQGLELAWTDPLSDVPRGIMIPQTPWPLPAVAGAGLPRNEPVILTLRGGSIPIMVKGEARYFPTLSPASGPFVLVNLEHYRELLRSLPRGSTTASNEYWIALDKGSDHSKVVQAIQKAIPFYTDLEDREGKAVLAASDPLAAGGWHGLALLALVAMVGAAVMGLGLYAALVVQSARVELAVVQALGFSRRQVMLWLGLEHAALAGVGLVPGVVLGFLLGRWTLSYLDSTGQGRLVVPPVSLAVDPGLAALVVGSAILAAGLAALLAVVLFLRLKSHDVLRMEP
ncbi:MAG: ABC transporter permease [Chloroflexi bacterium]|nr:ABC transporter permease [Chloroflexota bacterium]